MPPALAAHSLEKHYGDTAALGGVDLEVAPGELVGLLGPNGAGKSTLVKIACGLVRPTRGHAEICGRPAGSAPARASLGYLAELFRFPGWLSADELLELHSGLAGSREGPPAAPSCSSWWASPRPGSARWRRCRRGCSSGWG